MRIVLRSSKTGLYLLQPGQWAEQVDQARQFEHCYEALMFAWGQKLADLDVLMYFGDPKLDIAFPVRGNAAEVQPQAV